ncbi:MAG: calcium/sodium antiporter [Verrucomicrobiota bacterium JB023]|nr:calcium/sodium antiporter [Verrucomicrobiota bacterium JB023]
MRQVHKDTVLMPLLLTLLSFGVLFIGAELLVRGGAALALRLGLSSLVIGLTVVAYGTSLPEFVVSLKASLDGQSGIAVGNAIGSNIFNIAVILGLSALVLPLEADRTLVRRDCLIMVVATGVTVVTMWDGTISRTEGALLFLSSLAYSFQAVRMARKNPANSETGQSAQTKQATAIALIVTGLIVLVIGSRLLVDNATFIARSWGISEAVIGLTIIAAGTSMPELATSLVAALRRQSDISVGNVVGSNIFNLLFVIGAAALIHPITVAGLSALDFIALFAFTILLPLLFWGDGRLTRLKGASLLIGYVIYLTLLWPK